MFLCHSKIRALQALDTSNKEKIKDLENNLEETTKIVTFNNNNIQILIRRSILTKLPKNSMMSAISYICITWHLKGFLKNFGV